MSSDGYYNSTDLTGGDSYLLQYAGADAQLRNREHPVDRHSYRYSGGRTRPDTPQLALQPPSALCRVSTGTTTTATCGIPTRPPAATNTPPPTGSRANAPLRSMMSEIMMREAAMHLDRQNSYTTGYHHTHQYGQLAFTYYKEQQQEGRKYSSLLMQLYGGANFMYRKLKFDGVIDQRINRKWIDPEGTFYTEWNLPSMAHRLTFRYTFKGTGMDLMNLVDVTFDSDPLNLRQGNPDLKTGVKHSFNVNYESNKRIFGRLLLGLSADYQLTDRNIAMSRAYDRVTGVSISRPVNVDGCWYASGSLSVGLNLTPTDGLPSPIISLHR